MNRLRSLFSDPKRLRRMVFLWIPLFSLLWGGCQHVNETFEELGYCWDLRYIGLPEYRERHHRWPANLEEIERDHLASANALGRWRLRWFYFHYHPVMTVLEEGKSHILIRVQFTGWEQRSERVFSGDDEEAPEPGK